MTTLKEYRKEHPEIRRYKVLLCEHLKDKTQDTVDLNLWTGENMRVLLCPICSKVATQTAWDFIVRGVLLALDVSKQMEYKSWVEKG